MSLVKCPVCGARCYWNVLIGKVHWFQCRCGCFFHCERRDIDKIWNKEYGEKLANAVKHDVKRYPQRVDYLLRMYAPLVEELTYGREFLDIGFTIPAVIESMKERGWVSTGIDLIPNDYITGDFSTFDFGFHRYSFILMNDVLQCFDDPISVLQKAYSLLAPTGVLLVLTPDTEILPMLHHPAEFGHFGHRPHRCLFSRRQLLKSCDKIGYDMIMNWRNIDFRFFTTNELHLMLQKNVYTLDRETATKPKEVTDGEKNIIGTGK